MKLNQTFVLSMIACALACGAASAQQKVPGEKWRMKMSMQTEGFSMPGRTMEMCLPQGKAQEASIQQQPENGNCAVTNVRQSGNKMSADIKCTGKDAMEGHMEMEKLGENSMRGSMTGRTADVSMKMEYEYTKLGQACEAVDYSNYKPPVVEVPKFDACEQVASQLRQGDVYENGVALLTEYPTADGKSKANCSRTAAFKQFCEAVQTPAGYSDLDYREWQNRSQPAAAREDAAARMQRAPLTEAVSACGLGNSAALKTRMVARAEQDRRWGFLLYYATDAQYPKIKALAARECSGRSFTSAANANYSSLCRNYGAALARDDRPGVLQTAGCSAEREDRAQDICIGATRSGSGEMAQAGEGAALPAAATAPASGSGASAQPTDQEAEEKGAKDKAKDALDKGKKALRGLFGG